MSRRYPTRNGTKVVNSSSTVDKLRTCQTRAVQRRGKKQDRRELHVRIGVLTGGGDCPGLNAAIRAVVKHGEIAYGHSVVGFRNGWKGVAEGEFQPLTRGDVRSVLPL